jgi:uncharacterized protein YwqG
MSFFRSLFGKGGRGSADARGIGEHLDYLNSLREPAVALGKSDQREFARIGGLPDLPEGISWPEWHAKPLDFLCQLDMSQIPKEYVGLDVPRSGGLYFFYDQEQRTWGFDPKDRGSWRVIYAPVAPTGGHERKPPPDGHLYAQKPVAMSLVRTYPDWQDDRVASLKLTDRQFGEYVNLRSSLFAQQPAHHLFGYPSPVQGNDMELECQLASNGVYCGGATGRQDPRARALAQRKSDWVLLLQLDTDDDAGMMWGDCGMLYFWIKKDDLAAQRFDSCWMILQCS